jgi:predicted transposase/invertase (TIGR01784 family)
VVHKTPFEELSLSFVVTTHPYVLLQYLQEVRSYEVEEKFPGIYIISGDYLPMQIIETKLLPETKNLWLKNLSRKLTPEDLKRMLYEQKQIKDAVDMRGYFEVILKENIDILKEIINMSNIQQMLHDIFAESELAPIFEKQAEERGRLKGELAGKLKAAENMLKKGMELEEISELIDLSVETIKERLQSDSPA